MARLGGSLAPSTTTVAAVYVAAVGVSATLGFAVGSTAIILVAASMTLPSSLVAVPGYYLALGLVSQVPGANPSRSTGASWCDGNGACHATTAPEAASWFTWGTDVIGVLALVAAAALNLVLLRRMVAGRRVRAAGRHRT